MKTTIFTLAFLSTSFLLFSQNCGVVTSFTEEVTHNGNGTSNYTFRVNVISTSGGDKSLRVNTLTCGAYSFSIGAPPCYNSFADETEYILGPFTNIPTCTSSRVLNYTGRSNANCGGGSCTPINFASSSLPVELVTFKALNRKESVVLIWETASELDNEGFFLQRSVDGVRWESLHFIPGAGNSVEPHSYSHTDAAPFRGLNYYRLQQVNFDGTFEFSSIVSVKLENERAGLGIFPNPASGFAAVIMDIPYSGEATLSVFNMQGMVVRSEQVFVEERTVRKIIELDNLQAGIYFVQLQGGQEVWKQKLLVR